MIPCWIIVKISTQKFYESVREHFAAKSCLMQVIHFPDCALDAWCAQVASLRVLLTYLPHKAVAEVSKDKEPIGRERAEFNWFESQLMSDSNELRVK